MLAHNVYFKLKDDSEAAKDQLVAACQKYLKNHAGVEFFAAGKLGEEFSREVNDTDFDVSLHVFFTDKAAHDTYQDVEDHLTFIRENKENWKQVRVFDSYVD